MSIVDLVCPLPTRERLSVVLALLRRIRDADGFDEVLVSTMRRRTSFVERADTVIPPTEGERASHITIAPIHDEQEAAYRWVMRARQ